MIRIHRFIQDDIEEYTFLCETQEELDLLQRFLRGKKPKHMWVESWGGYQNLRCEIGPVEES